MTNDWYTIEIHTESGREVLADGLDSLTKAQILAKAIRTNPNVLTATVLRSRRPGVVYDGPTTGKETPNINDQQTWNKYSNAMVVYASVDNRGYEVTTESDTGSWAERIAMAASALLGYEPHRYHAPRPFRPTRSNADKAAWAAPHPNPFNYRRLEAAA